MNTVLREDQVSREHDILSSDAAFSDESEGRARSADPDMLRNDYQRDRDKILHAKSFRRLSHKTQVFLAAEGDHYRTRLTHTLEVAQIARTAARALGLNEDLTEAVALGHDLGHTPFGHTGEDALSKRIAHYRGGSSASARTASSASARTARRIPSDRSDLLFRHNEQSLRVVEVIENGGRGLNLTSEVRDGIYCHTGTLRAETLEGRIVGVADRIAYVNHDIDDAIRAGLLHERDLPESTHRVLGANHSSRIETLVLDLVEASDAAGDIRMSDEVRDAMMELRAFLFDRVYTAPVVQAEVDKAALLVEHLFDCYMERFDLVPEEYREMAEGDRVRAVCDYVAGMTDRYATDQFLRLFVPQALRADGSMGPGPGVAR